MYGLALYESQMKEGDFDYLNVVQGRLIKVWFGVSKFCSTTALREAIRWKRASEVVFCQLRHGARMGSFMVGEDTQSIPFGKQFTEFHIYITFTRLSSCGSFEQTSCHTFL